MRRWWRVVRTERRDWSPAGRRVVFDADSPEGVGLFAVEPNQGRTPGFVTLGLQVIGHRMGMLVFVVRTSETELLAELWTSRADGIEARP
jgi:hypothetical protein